MSHALILLTALSVTLPYHHAWKLYPGHHIRLAVDASTAIALSRDLLAAGDVEQSAPVFGCIAEYRGAK